MAINKQEKKITKQTATQKIHANNIHAKIGHPGEDRMCATTKHLQYSVRETLDVCEDWAMAEITQKFLHKVTRERDLKTGESIYLDLISQKKPSYVVSKNWIII